MKKHIVTMILLLLCLGVFVSVAAAKGGTGRNAASPSAPEVSPQIPDEVIDKLHRIYPDDAFGGIYLDGDTVVVNITCSEESARARAEGKLGEGVRIEYRAVKYPLGVLENVKDLLTQHMGEYRIAALDANEVTNRVDVSLYDYNDRTFEEIRQLVAGQFGEDIPLNFIDMRGTEIRFS